MALIIELNPEDEARLARLAAREGLDPAALAKKLVTERLPDMDANRSADGVLDASPQERVRALLKEWQTQDNTPVIAGPEPLPGETPTRALFRTWAEEDAAMTDEERAAEERFWEDYQTGIDAERRKAGMRTLF